ncbi:hypothetical protein FHR24_001548 [Wenyingzhuangia heitensis]|uniref:Uncharacterized protein n=1 Tax=Wenyingzhuangia heitensis TaxID=1487859 RepID=A0ABX0U8E1_9FLAO|nr:hypothetical protein [Wenyingzhuangia heitensis]
MGVSSTKKRKYRRKKSKNKKQNRLNTFKLFLIFIGSIFILFGLLIGDLNIDIIKIPYYVSIAIGLVFQLITIYIFVKQKSIQT